MRRFRSPMSPAYNARAMVTSRLDAKGLVCPLPVLRARKALKALRQGDILEIEATDPASVRDFAAFCDMTGSTLLESTDKSGVFRFRIRKEE